MTIAQLDVRELLELALLLVAVGALSGFLAGLFGIGGGAILVPVFYECFRLAGVPLEVRMPLCIGTARHHHPDLGPILSRPLCPRRGGYGNPQGMVAAGVDRRGRRQPHRALRAGAAVQVRVRRDGMVRRGAPAAGAPDLEVRRGSSERTADENLWLPGRDPVDADGHRRRIGF